MLDDDDDDINMDSIERITLTEYLKCHKKIWHNMRKQSGFYIKHRTIIMSN